MGVSVGNLASIGLGVCKHGTVTLPTVITWPAGSSTVMAEGSSVLNAVSVGISSCGCPAVPLSFSSVVLAEGSGLHRLGDTGMTSTGNYALTSAANTVMTG